MQTGSIANGSQEEGHHQEKGREKEEKVTY
jgi:hypothetical protein